MTLLELQRRLALERNTIDILSEYIAGGDLEVRRIFVSSLIGMDTSHIRVMISLYIDNTGVLTVGDMIKSIGTLFEINDVTYQCAGMFNGSPMFRKIGSEDLIIPDFKLDDKVRRIF
jgi:hypothetical protein